MELPPPLPYDEVLALLFPERVGRYDAWHNAVKGLNMIESPLIAELLGQARVEGKVEGKAEGLLRVLQKRYRELPEEMTQSIRGGTSIAQLDHWLDIALEAESLEHFRRQTGL
jgi:hypothetical protein